MTFNNAVSAIAAICIIGGALWLIFGLRPLDLPQRPTLDSVVSKNRAVHLPPGVIVKRRRAFTNATFRAASSEGVSSASVENVASSFRDVAMVNGWALTSDRRADGWVMLKSCDGDYSHHVEILPAGEGARWTVATYWSWDSRSERYCRSH